MSTDITKHLKWQKLTHLETTALEKVQPNINKQKQESETAEGLTRSSLPTFIGHYMVNVIGPTLRVWKNIKPFKADFLSPRIRQAQHYKWP